MTVHECGHQFWYGVVGNNEFEHAWLDEGLNTFSTARVMDETFSPGFNSIRLFGDFIPWVFYDLPQTRETSGDRHERLPHRSGHATCRRRRPGGTSPRPAGI